MIYIKVFHSLVVEGFSVSTLLAELLILLIRLYNTMVLISVQFFYLD